MELKREEEEETFAVSLARWNWHEFIRYTAEHSNAAVLHNIGWTVANEQASHLYLNIIKQLPAATAAVQIRRLEEESTRPEWRAQIKRESKINDAVGRLIHELLFVHVCVCMRGF